MMKTDYLGREREEQKEEGKEEEIETRDKRSGKEKTFRRWKTLL